MGLKSKSVVTIIILAFVGILTFGTGAFVLTRAKTNRFASDGYILTAEAAGDADSTVASSSVWFGAGRAYTSGTTGISFTDAQGNVVTVDEDSFVHYTDDSFSAVKNTVVMDLDNYVQDYIQYYYLEQGSAIASDNGAYFIKAQEDAPSFSNFLMKSSDLHYLIGSPTMYFFRSSDTEATAITTGYVEITYLSDDYSIALVNDGSSAWQMLTGNAYIQLENGVRFELSTGALSYGGSESEEASTYYVGDIDVDVNLNVEVYSSTVYPTYRFTVINGTDGADGEDGDNGDNGEEGIRGEQGEAGTDGTTAGEGTAGETGGNGTAGSAAEEGFSGGIWDGIEVVGKVPVVQIREWSIAGSVLHFIAYMDEDSCDLIEENTSSILLEDLDGGNFVEWTADGDEQGQSVDFSEDNSDGFEFYYNQIVPGHSYRMTISATYTLNGVKNTQALLVRNFTADDYGVVFNRTASDSKSVTYSIELTNSNVALDQSSIPVTITVNGKEYNTGVANWTTDDLKNIVIEYDRLGDGEENINYAGQEMNIAFTVKVIVNNYNYADNEYVMSGKKTLSFEDSLTVRKAQPTVGGIRLTAYNSGLFLAEILGEYNPEEDTYKDVDDADDAITAIRFELYSGIRQDANDRCATLETLVETIEVTSGYIGYFPVTDTQEGSGVTLNHYYYVKAYCVMDDGEMVSELPVKETRQNLKSSDDSWISTIDNNQYKHANGEMAWDYAILNNITATSISFVGTDGIYNTADNTQNPGITFNRINGSIYAVIAKGSDYFISTGCPIEIQVSASPDYYVSLKYDSISSIPYANTDSMGRYVYQANELKTDGDEENVKPITAVGSSTEDIVVKLPIDLTGLKANTTYLINMYGYENPTGIQDPDKKDLDRVIMGSMAISTADERNITVTLKQDTSASLNGEIGCILTLGESGADRYDDEEDYQDYMLYTDASYRSLSSITLDLYRQDKSTGASAEDTLVGTCVISDTRSSTGSDPDRNSLYELFYGTSTKGLIGVGKDYTYKFVDPKNKSSVITPLNMVGGTYYIVVSGACDYTEARYNNRQSENSAYTYYGWRSAQSQYVNNLVINKGVQEKISNLEITNSPFMQPSELVNKDGTYITVEQIKNSDAYMCSKKDGATLYCDSWDADTVAGLKLTTNYKQQDTGDGSTTYFTFYGFTKEAYQEKAGSGETLIEKADSSGSEQQTVASKDNFFFKYEFPLSENSDTVGDYSPEIWLMFYDPEVNTDIENAFSGKEKQDEGYVYVDSIDNPDKNANCPKVIVIYMDKEYFTRGQTYYFAYDAELAYYEWEYENDKGEIVTHDRGFHFPEDYYTYYETDKKYNFDTSLKSGAVTVERQTPVVYSWLENTTSAREDNWSVYISDPDNAIEWDSLLNSALSDSYTRGNGGIYGYLQKLTTPITLQSSADGKGYSIPISSDAVSQNMVTETLPADTKIVEDSTLKKFAANLTQENGGKLLVGGLPADGMIYNVYLNYKLQDDGAEKVLRVISHNFMGSVMINGSDSASASTFAMTLDASNADHNTMKIYFGLSEEENGNSKSECYLTSDYLSKIESIAAVRVRAKIKKATDVTDADKDPLTANTSDWKYIMEQELQEDGTYQPSETVIKDVWVVPNAPSPNTTAAENGSTAGYTDYRYYLEFALSDFDDTGNTQYGVGDLVSFDVLLYYATGESVAWTAEEDGNYTIDTTSDNSDSANGQLTGYVVRYVDRASSDKTLYDSGQKRIWGSYVVAQNLTLIGPSVAAQSFYQIKGTMTSAWEAQRGSTKKQLEWRQTTQMISETFNKGYSPQNEATLRKNLSGETNTIIGETSDAVEIIRTATASYGGTMTTEVQSFVPQLEDFTATPGLTTVNIAGNVKNASLVEYPGSESFHLYYLVYKVGSTKADQELVGAMIGEPLSGGNLNLDFALEKNTQYHIQIYYKAKNDLTDEQFRDFTDANIFGEPKYNGSSWGKAKAGVFYKVSGSSTESGLWASYIASRITSSDVGSVFVPVQGVKESATYVTTKEGIRISSTELTLNTTSTPAMDEETTIEDGRTIKFTTSIASDIVKKEQPTLRIFYRLERVAQNTYDAASDKDSVTWDTVIADKREPETVLNGLTWSDDENGTLSAAHFWQYYDADPDTNGDDMSYAPNPNAISSTNTMQMRYYTGGLITPGYYYRVTTRVYQKSDEAWVNVTLSDTANDSDAHAESVPELWEDSLNITSQIRNSESNSITVTFSIYDTNNTSVDGKYFARLAKKQSDGTWEVQEYGKSNVAIANSGLRYDQAYDMNQIYTDVKFTGLDASSTYRLQFYAAYDTDYDNHIDATTADSYLTGNLTTNILDTSYYPKKDTGISAPESQLSAAYEEAFAYKNPYNNTSSLEFANSPLLVGVSSETSTLISGLTAYAGRYTGMYSVLSTGNAIELSYGNAFNTGEIDKISYDVELTTSTGATVTYAMHDIYANDTLATYGSYYFTDKKGNPATSGSVVLHLTLNTFSESADDTGTSEELNMKTKSGEYTIKLRFYRAKRDAANNIIYDGSGNPIYEQMKMDGDLDPIFTVQ